MTDQSVRDRILEKAREFFYEKGYYETKMDDIAKALNIAKGTLYIYFKSKADLLIEVIKEDHIRIMKELEEIVSRDTSAMHKLSSFIDTIWDILYEAKNMLVVSETKQMKAIFEKEVLERYMREVMPLRNNIREYLKRILLEGISKGEFRKDINVETIVHSIPWLVIGAFHRHDANVDYNEKESIKKFVQGGLSAC